MSPGARDVRAAAQLGGRIAHAQHAHALAVLFAEQRHRAEVERFLHAHVAHFGHVVVADLRVDHAFDRREFLRRHRLEVREVETQAIGRDQRTLLRDMRAEHAAQRGVQQVRGAVVEDRRGAALDIDRADEMVADLQRARGERADVRMELARELLRVAHLEHRALLRQAARVADLATALGVERRTIEDDDRFVAERRCDSTGRPSRRIAATVRPPASPWS
jgi:hypothetical protein